MLEQHREQIAHEVFPPHESNAPDGERSARPS